MSQNYDNWERLVRAVMRKEELRRIALRPSMDSISISSASSSFRAGSTYSSPMVNGSFPVRRSFEFPAVNSDDQGTMARSESLNPIGYGPQEEALWLREEQRWLREEQRWLREELRWKEERQRLVQEINSLKLRVQELEQLNSLPAASASDMVANVAKLLQMLKDGDSGKNVNRITESGSSAVPLVVEAAIKNEEVVVKEVVSVRGGKETVKRRVTLRNGSEGEEVRAMQEALQKLGFYSGEEDIEFSSFSSGTERAVKTWQSSIGVRENGIMTAELLEQLYMEQKFESPGPGATKNKENKSAGPKKSENGAPIPSITDISEVLKTEEEASEVSRSPNRVFLLGENRWEEPSRLSGSSRRTVPNKTGSSNATVVKCLACRGEGRIFCMECDGTGEPNIEPQFLEWVDEGTKCPYCECLGYTMCDVCGGATTTDAL